MRLYLASSNAHKLEEVGAILREADPSIEVLGAAAVGGMPAVEEDADTFAGNARKKAVALAARVPPGCGVLADDSGLCVDGLNGQPGVRSSRFAGDGAADGENTALLLEKMKGIADEARTAHFRCVLVLLGPGGLDLEFDGTCSGRIARQGSGRGGFGYDPVFLPDGYSESFAELPAETKNRISHRANALRRLSGWLREGDGPGQAPGGR